MSVDPGHLPAVATPARVSSSQTTAPQAEGDAPRLRAVARDLERAFLSEMLKHGGLGETGDSFGGGIGEAQFASFLRDEHARLLTERGGIGLSESIFRALSARAAAL